MTFSTMLHFSASSKSMQLSQNSYAWSPFCHLWWQPRSVQNCVLSDGICDTIKHISHCSCSGTAVTLIQYMQIVSRCYSRDLYKTFFCTFVIFYLMIPLTIFFLMQSSLKFITYASPRFLVIPYSDGKLITYVSKVTCHILGDTPALGDLGDLGKSTLGYSPIPNN